MDEKGEMMSDNTTDAVFVEAEEAICQRCKLTIGEDEYADYLNGDYHIDSDMCIEKLRAAREKAQQAAISYAAQLDAVMRCDGEEIGQLRERAEQAKQERDEMRDLIRQANQNIDKAERERDNLQAVVDAAKQVIEKWNYYQPNGFQYPSLRDAMAVMVAAINAAKKGE